VSRDPHDAAAIGLALRDASLALASANMDLRRGSWNAAQVHVVAALRAVTRAEIALPSLAAVPPAEGHAEPTP
jgi:hypothetical protein